MQGVATHTWAASLYSPEVNNNNVLPTKKQRSKIRSNLLLFAIASPPLYRGGSRSKVWWHLSSYPRPWPQYQEF